MSLSCARGKRREWGRNEGVRLERRRGGRRSRCPTGASSAVRVAALFCRTGAYHLVASALVHLRDPHVDEDQLRCRCRGHVHRHRQKGLGATGPHGPRPRARKEWQITQRKKLFLRLGTQRVVHHFRVLLLATASSRVTAAMRGRLYATALPAIFLALLLATASAQENHQDTAGVPEGFDADAQAARDAEAYLTPEEKSVIQIGNDLLRGNATIPERDDYDVDTVRTRALVSLASYAHVPSAPDYVSEHVALARHDTWHQLPGCYSCRAKSPCTSANRADVLLSRLPHPRVSHR